MNTTLEAGIHRLRALDGPPPALMTPPGRRLSIRLTSATDAIQLAAQVEMVQISPRYTRHATSMYVAVALFCREDQLPPRVYETKG